MPLSQVVFLATVKGFRNGNGQGRVVALQQIAAATSGMTISANALGNVLDMTDPFALERINNNDLLVIQPRTGEPDYSHPFDLATDSIFASGNLVVTEGLTLLNLATGVLSQDGNGRIRAIPSLGHAESDRSRVMQSNLVAPRGP